MIISEQEQAISGSSNVVKIIMEILASEHETDRGREHFWAIGVNTKNIIQYIELVSLGSLSESIVHPRETFRLAVMKGVAALIFCHNHPSGDTHPSSADIELTRRLGAAGRILGIGVLDHVIIGKTGQSFSFQEQGLFDPFYKSALSDDKEYQRQLAPEKRPSSPRKKKAIVTGEGPRTVSGAELVCLLMTPKEIKRGEAIAAAAPALS